MRLSRLVLAADPGTEDEDRAREVCMEIYHDVSVVVGLPRHMKGTAVELAKRYIEQGVWRDWLFTVLLLAQARPGNEPAETLLLRQDLEQMSYELLYG